MPKPTSVTCGICSIVFAVPVGRGRIPKFCSDRCRSKNRHRQYYRPKSTKPESANCALCGSTFAVPRQAGPTPKYCGLECRAAAEKGKRRWRNRPKRAKVETPCTGCGELVLGNARAGHRWCSESCRNKWRYANDAEYRLRSKRNRPTGPRRYPKVCAWCGVTFEASSEHVRCCSTSCAAHLRYSGQTCPISPTQCSRCGLWRSRKGSGCGCRRKRQKVYTDAERESLMAARECRWCRERFEPTNLQAAVNGAAFCSRACIARFHRNTAKGRLAAQEAKQRRRARERNAYVAPVNRDEIFRRDGFVCQLCGDPLDMNAVVPDPLAPTIDHVIPLAKGGTHEPANVQAAHFLCNALKSDKVEASATVAA